MRDFPMFTTEYGVGSLVLKEIPYTGAAYITIRDSAQPEAFLAECTDFCRAVGAQKVFATGNVYLEKYPVYTSVIQMSASWDMIPETDACLFPVTESTLVQWQRIYNERMQGVDNAAYMSDRVAKDMLARGDGYYIHRDGQLLGIGMASDDKIDCIASVIPGKGRDVVCALAHALMCDRVTLEVASTNSRAIKLYESLGFIQTAELSKWYKII